MALDSYTYAPQSFRAGRIVSIAGVDVFLILGLVCVKWPLYAGVAAWPD
jgi:hypothetical protein